MKLVIKDNKVFATHDDGQLIENLSDYDGCKFVVDDEFVGGIGDTYIVTKEQEIGALYDEQIAVLTQFDITWSRNVVLGKKTAQQMETARATIIQSYTDRISEVQNG